MVRATNEFVEVAFRNENWFKVATSAADVGFVFNATHARNALTKDFDRQYVTEAAPVEHTHININTEESEDYQMAGIMEERYNWDDDWER